MTNKKDIFYYAKLNGIDEYKPYLIKDCVNFETCKKGLYGCRGCNVWNYLYDVKALQEWCKENGKEMQFVTMEMHRKLRR